MRPPPGHLATLPAKDRGWRCCLLRARHERNGSRCRCQTEELVASKHRLDIWRVPACTRCTLDSCVLCASVVHMSFLAYQHEGPTEACRWPQTPRGSQIPEVHEAWTCLPLWAPRTVGGNGARCKQGECGGSDVLLADDRRAGREKLGV